MRGLGLKLRDVLSVAQGRLFYKGVDMNNYEGAAEAFTRPIETFDDFIEMNLRMIQIWGGLTDDDCRKIKAGTYRPGHDIQTEHFEAESRYWQSRGFSVDGADMIAAFALDKGDTR